MNYYLSITRSAYWAPNYPPSFPPPDCVLSSIGCVSKIKRKFIRGRQAQEGIGGADYDECRKGLGEPIKGYVNFECS